MRNRERRNSFRQAVDTKVPVDQYGRPYEAIWFPGQEDEDQNQTSPRTSNGPSNIDTRLLADGPVYANASPLGESNPNSRKVSQVSQESRRQDHEGRKLSSESMALDPRQLRKSDASLRSSHSGHIRSGSYDNIPTPGPQAPPPQQFPDPSGSYEAIAFQQPGLQSVGLVAEACRDYQSRASAEPRIPPEPQTRAPLSKQNSGSSIGGHARMPPPYQSPPGPPPPYQPPPLSAPSPQRLQGKHTSPQVRHNFPNFPILITFSALHNAWSRLQ